MTVGIYTLTSALHDEESVDSISKGFLKEIETQLGFAFNIEGSNFATYGQHDLNLIYVRTGGSEALFKKAFPQLSGNIYLLTSGKSNSLAASMEILSYLNQEGRKGEILHGRPEYIAERIKTLAKVSSARKKLDNINLGVIGKPSDWLISSHVDRDAVKAKLGINLVDIPIEEVVEHVRHFQKEGTSVFSRLDEQAENVRKNIAATIPAVAEKYSEGAFYIYLALKEIIAKYNLKGFTLRCFDLLDALGNTGCIALALINAEGYPAGCEGDVPTLLTMAVGNAITGVSGFQCNPSQIDPTTGEILLAHCTIPFNMVTECSYNTHFESGIGLAVHGIMPKGDVTIFKLSGDLKRNFCHAAQLDENRYEDNLCRTQIHLNLSADVCSNYFLKSPIGNHHVVFPGNCTDIFDAFVRSI